MRRALLFLFAAHVVAAVVCWWGYALTYDPTYMFRSKWEHVARVTSLIAVALAVILSAPERTGPGDARP